MVAAILEQPVMEKILTHLGCRRARRRGPLGSAASGWLREMEVADVKG